MGTGGQRHLLLITACLVACCAGVCGLSSQAANVLSFTIQPGSLKPINTTDSGVQRAVKVATYEYNNRSNDEFIFRASEVDEAEIQVVKGVKYFLAVKISRTVCHKRDRPDLDNCDFQPDGRLKQTFRCHFEVWVIPWQHWIKTTALLCH
ncbi:cystatin-F [Polypterus senegalus]|uniref:cystatin-F n=1 Tax=Polypterus senegalus TaxID=55291 RepID=UPI0019641320|nr:cystatin-F [Polypterus senegalus]XP_039594811.1 cystatin-F [Polypterus senegalus]